jgi:hypothetical protein
MREAHPPAETGSSIGTLDAWVPGCAEGYQSTQEEMEPWDVRLFVNDTCHWRPGGYPTAAEEEGRLPRRLR